MTNLLQLRETVARLREGGFTPGPWKIVSYGDGDSLVICEQDDTFRICFMATPGGSPASWAKIKANAALIAEAPDLLTGIERLLKREEALREALDDLQQAEAEYRLMHDRHGDGAMAAGRAWDRMRRCGDKARTTLAETQEG